MIKNLLKIFGVLFILLFQLTSCVDFDDDRQPVYFFYDEPVVVVQMGNEPYIRNESYTFYVPDLADKTELKYGDLLWASFTIDLDDQEQPSSRYAQGNVFYTAKNFNFKSVDSAKVILPANTAEFQSYLSDDYSAPIELSVLYKYVIDSLWFFGFEQKDQSNKLGHTYELILNPEKEDSNYPVLYIRSKQVNIPAENQAKDQQKRNVFAFDIADFVKYYKEKYTSNGEIRFNIKYKTGTDPSGKDVYKEFMSNPITWVFNK